MKNREMFRHKPERFGAAGGGQMEFDEIEASKLGEKEPSATRERNGLGETSRWWERKETVDGDTVSEVLTSRLVGPVAVSAGSNHSE